MLKAIRYEYTNRELVGERLYYNIGVGVKEESNDMTAVIISYSPFYCSVLVSTVSSESETSRPMRE